MLRVKEVWTCAHEHTHTHRVDTHYNVLIGWNLNDAQAKQSESQPGRGCVCWTEADVFLVFREDYRELLNSSSQMKSILLSRKTQLVY